MPAAGPPAFCPQHKPRPPQHTGALPSLSCCRDQLQVPDWHLPDTPRLCGDTFCPLPAALSRPVPHGERLFPHGLAVPAHGPHHVPFLQTFWTLSSTSEPVSVTLNLTRVAAPSTAFQSRTVRPAPRDPAQGLSRGRPHLCPEDPSGCEVGPVGRRRRRRRPGRLPPPSPHRPGGAFASSCFSKA